MGPFTKGIDKELTDLGKNLMPDGNPIPKPGTLIQQNTLIELASLSTSFIPQMTVGELVEITGKKGVGVGTLMTDKGNVVGEVTVIDGKAYVSETSFGKKGNTREARPDEMVYFAQVGYFESKELPAIKLSKDDDFVKNHPDFKSHITKQILEDYIREKILGSDPEKNGAFVVKMINARFDNLKLRSVDGSAEYEFDDGTRKAKNLGEVMEKQTQVEFKEPKKRFRVAGVYNNMDAGEVSTSESFEGLHLHAVDRAGNYGGHVQIQEMQMNSCIIQVMPVQQWLIATKEHATEIGFREAEHPKTSVEIELARKKAKAFSSAGYGLGH